METYNRFVKEQVTLYQPHSSVRAGGAARHRPDCLANPCCPLLLVSRNTLDDLHVRGSPILRDRSQCWSSIIRPLNSFGRHQRYRVYACSPRVLVGERGQGFRERTRGHNHVSHKQPWQQRLAIIDAAQQGNWSAVLSKECDTCIGINALQAAYDRLDRQLARQFRSNSRTCSWQAIQIQLVSLNVGNSTIVNRLRPSTLWCRGQLGVPEASERHSDVCWRACSAKAEDWPRGNRYPGATRIQNIAKSFQRVVVIPRFGTEGSEVEI
jgi:hypothetical protein